ncbi:54S ribosomal protein L4 mitochondrial [Savitreella phatthalungensis]
MLPARRVCQAVSSTSRTFSTTTLLNERKRRRPQVPAGIELPAPSTYVHERPGLSTVSATHPLWGFFRPSRQTVPPPKEEAKHGRSWTAEELRAKSFEDLHGLWIACLKERNILSTQDQERRRQRLVGRSPGQTVPGEKEAAYRKNTVKRTMARIKFVLHERQTAYYEARELAALDEDVKGFVPDYEHMHPRELERHDRDRALLLEAQRHGKLNQPSGTTAEPDTPATTQVASEPSPRVNA